MTEKIKKEIPFNVNSFIKVRMRPAGWAEFERQLRELRLDPAPYRAMHPEDKDGYSKWQLWDFIRTVGPITYMGPPTPYETEIILLPED